MYCFNLHKKRIKKIQKCGLGGCAVNWGFILGIILPSTSNTWKAPGDQVTLSAGGNRYCNGGWKSHRTHKPRPRLQCRLDMNTRGQQPPAIPNEAAAALAVVLRRPGRSCWLSRGRWRQRRAWLIAPLLLRTVFQPPCGSLFPFRSVRRLLPLPLINFTAGPRKLLGALTIALLMMFHLCGSE